MQFAGPVKPEWLDAVSDAGGEVVDTYAGFTVVVRADDTQIAQIAQLPVVRWAGHLPPDARVSIADPDAPPLPRTKLLPDTVIVEFFTPREARKGRAEIRNLGLRITSAEVEAGVLVVELPEGTAASQRRLIEAISQIHGVRMVRRKALNRISNDIAVGPMRASGSALGGATNIDGAGEIVAICDTGFDIGTTTPAHPDFVGRVKSIKSYPITSDFADYIRNPGVMTERPTSIPAMGRTSPGQCSETEPRAQRWPARLRSAESPTRRVWCSRRSSRRWTGGTRLTSSATAGSCWPGSPPTSPRSSTMRT